MKASRYIPHYTIEEWERWEGRWELWRGVPVAMSPSPRRIHHHTLHRPYRHIEDQIEAKDASGGCEMLREIDWRIGQDLVVCPDLSIICGQDDGHFITRTPTLIAEVLSPSTQLKDRNQKRALYHERGEKYYAMLDPDGQQFQVLRFDEDKEVGVERGEDGCFAVELHEGCAARLDPAKVWGV
ncbi:MAG: Uma2 family endonuclease [Planctomycetota bacterium]